MSDRAGLIRLLRELRAEQVVEKAAALMAAIVGLFDEVRDELTRDADKLRGQIQAAKDFHPRAAKLIAKRKNFLVVAEDEPYFRQVYDLIRDHEMEKGTWTQEDQWHYDDAIYPVKLTGSIQEKAAQVADAMEDIVDQIARKLGFAGNDELITLVSAIDLSDPVTLAEYKVWQMEDGTKAGLLAAFPELAKPAS